MVQWSQLIYSQAVIHMRNRIFQTLFPVKADNTHVFGALPVIVFALITLLGVVRSLVHIFAADGGAGSIAGMDLSQPGAEGIIFAFGLWGSSQLLMALVQIVVLVRYRSLIPLMYLVIIIEVLLRMLIGVIKPVAFSHTPPGAVGNWIFLGLALIMLEFCLAAPVRDKD